MIIEDTLFYWLHRLLHVPFFYKLLHKKHHEYNNSVGIAASYAHPFEYLLTSLLPTVMGPVILSTQSHYATHMIWFFWRNKEAIDGHWDMNSHGLLIECFRWVHQAYIIITTIVRTTERTDHYSHSGIVYVVQIFLMKKERVLKRNEYECFV